MQKWGFLVKHDRWLAVEGYSVTVRVPCNCGGTPRRPFPPGVLTAPRDSDRSCEPCLQVFSRAPEPDVKPALSQAPVEMKFQLTDCKCLFAGSTFPRRANDTQIQLTIRA